MSPSNTVIVSCQLYRDSWIPKYPASCIPTAGCPVSPITVSHQLYPQSRIPSVTKYPTSCISTAVSPMSPSIPPAVSRQLDPQCPQVSRQLYPDSWIPSVPKYPTSCIPTSPVSHQLYRDSWIPSVPKCPASCILAGCRSSVEAGQQRLERRWRRVCLLYTSDAADE